MGDAGDTSIDPDVLLGVVRKILGASETVLTDWVATPMPSRLGGGGNIHRIAGSAKSDGLIRAWSVVRKSLHAGSPAISTEQDGQTNWSREADIYESGILKQLPPPVRAPRCFAVERSPTQCDIWLEDVRAETEVWSLEDYRLAAYDLGAFNARCTSIAAFALWGTGERLARTLERWRFLVPLIESTKLAQHPLVASTFPPDLRKQALSLWDRRHALIDDAASLPQIMAHGDANRDNLFRGAAGDRHTVAVDWAGLGLGAPGMDSSQLVMSSLMRFQVDAQEATSLDSAVIAGYLAGLGDAGWKGHPEDVRRGHVICAALRWGIPSFLGLAVATQPDLRAEWEHRFQASLESLMRQWGLSATFLLELLQKEL